MVNVSDLEFGYGKYPVLRNLNLTLQCGNVYCLLGKNGVGKTTLLKLLSGLLKPTGGSIDVDGKVPFKRTPDFLKDIYFLSEDFICDNLTPVAYAKIYSPFYPNFDMGRFMELLKLFEVLPDVKLTKMSFGQQKKAMISFALSANTKILLMDEPSNGLDIPSKNQLRQAISSIVTEDKFIVISTHQAKDLDSLIDPVIIMDNDGVILNESIESISEKLCFSLEPQVNPVAIYSELTLGGVLNVSLNTQGVESVVNIEALFNATLNNRDLIVSLFRK